MSPRTRKTELDQLKAELANMGRRLMELTEDSMEDVEDAASTFSESARQAMDNGWSKAKDLGQNSVKSAQEYAEENPWQMLAAGVAVGMALAFFLKRDRE